MNPAELEAYHAMSREERWTEENRWTMLTQTHYCEECGEDLVIAQDPELNHRVLRCRQSKDHQGYAKTKSIVRLWKEGWRFDAITEGVLREKYGGSQVMVEHNLTREQTTALAQYQGMTSLSKQEATTILTTLWRDAPQEAVQRAALLCASYNLNPLMKHIFLVKYWNKKENRHDWETLQGIDTPRLLAHRAAAKRGTTMGFIDNTPRIMTDAEQTIYNGEVDDKNWWAITQVKDSHGNTAHGVGSWPKKSYKIGEKEIGVVYGADKGNTAQNMAKIRSERPAYKRLFPGEMPDIMVADPYMVDAEASVGVETVPAPPKKIESKAPDIRANAEPRDMMPDEDWEPENKGALFSACFTHFKLGKKEALEAGGYHGIKDTDLAPPLNQYWERIRVAYLEQVQVEAT